MKRDEILSRLSAVFREVFDDEAIVAHDEMTARDVSSWDSLSNIRMIVAVEEDLGISFSTAEITDLKNVGALVDVIARKIGND
jgi:acyl carrier protein